VNTELAGWVSMGEHVIGVVEGHFVALAILVGVRVREEVELVICILVVCEL